MHRREKSARGPTADQGSAPPDSATLITTQRAEVANCPKLSIAATFGNVGSTANTFSWHQHVSHLCELAANRRRHSLRNLDRLVAFAMHSWRPYHIQRPT